MKSLQNRLKVKLPTNGAFYSIIVLVLVMVIATNKFFTISNLTNIARQGSVASIITICSFLAILTHQTDLSVGATASLTAVVVAHLARNGMPVGIACLIAILIGLVIGLANGLLIGYTKIAPFIITLGMMMIAQSVGVIITGGQTLIIQDKAFLWLGEGNLLRTIPVPAMLTLILFIGFAFLLKMRPYGTSLYAVGGNEDASKATGIDVRNVKLSVFLINGVLATVAGFVLAARLGSANPSQGMGLELDGIAGAVLGGTSLDGGRGSIWGALLGAIALTVLRNALNIIGLPSAVQMMVIGAIMILILAVDTFRRR